MVPEILGAFLLAGIVAAALSSASTFLSLVGFSVSNDIGRKPLALTVSTSRRIMLITSLIILVCCYFFPPNIFWFSGFLAFTLRIAAWGKKRLQEAKRIRPEGSTPLVFRVLGGIIIAFGLFVAITGVPWQEPVTAFLTAPKWSADLVLWLPYWPFEPYLSIFIIGLGATLFTKTRN